MDDNSKVDLEDVIDRYENLIAENPHNPEYHKELGNAFLRSGAYDLALEEYRTCLHIDARYFPAQYNMGNCYFVMERFHQAIIAWQKALILNPKLEHAIFNVAFTYFKLGKAESDNDEMSRRFFDDALMEFQKAVELRPGNKDTYLHMGLTWYELDHFDNAVNSYLEVLRIDPDDTDAHYNLGNVYYEKGLDDPSYFERAIQEFQTVIRLSGGKDPKARNNIADCLLRLDRTTEAIKEIGTVLSQEPDYPPAICTLAELHSQQGDHLAAIEGFKKIVDLDPEKDHLLHKFASRKLIEEYSQLLQVRPGQHETHFELARAYKDLGIAYRDRTLILKARDEIRNAIELGPGKAGYHIELADCYYRLNNTDQAILEVESALALEPDSVIGHCLLGEIYVRVGDKELAQLEFATIRRIHENPNGGNGARVPEVVEL